MKFVIISKDRPSQLFSLIRSIRQHENTKNSAIFVVYNFSSEEFKTGYQRVAHACAFIRDNTREPVVKFFNDINLGIRGTLKGVMAYMDATTCLLTDDCIFFRNPDVCTNYIGRELNTNPEIFAFSYRLGLNTTIQNYQNGMRQPAISEYDTLDENTIAYKYKNHHPETNYGLHFGWDGMCYRTSLLKNIFKMNIQELVSNPQAIYPQQVENLLSKGRSEEQKDKMLINKHSSVVCMNYNSTHPYADFNSYSLVDLNKALLDNYIIDYNSDSFNNIESCHHNIPLKFTKLSDNIIEYVNQRMDNEYLCNIIDNNTVSYRGLALDNPFASSRPTIIRPMIETTNDNWEDTVDNDQ